MITPPKKTVCRTPTPGKKPTRIDAAKFALVRHAILAVIPRRGEGLRFRDLPRLAASRLSPQERRSLGSVNWYVTTVKLELEVQGAIRRLPGVIPQRLVRA